jgi:hypothetical protein
LVNQVKFGLTFYKEKKKMKTIITAWPDSDSWIVSEDRVEDTYQGGTNTGAIRTTTLDVCDTYDEAIHRAREIALERMLPAYEQDRQGSPSILFEPNDAAFAIGILQRKEIGIAN